MNEIDQFSYLLVPSTDGTWNRVFSPAIILLYFFLHIFRVICVSIINSHFMFANWWNPYGWLCSIRHQHHIWFMCTRIANPGERMEWNDWNVSSGWNGINDLKWETKSYWNRRMHMGNVQIANHETCYALFQLISLVSARHKLAKTNHFQWWSLLTVRIKCQFVYRFFQFRNSFQFCSTRSTPHYDQ